MNTRIAVPFAVAVWACSSPPTATAGAPHAALGTAQSGPSGTDFTPYAAVAARLLADARADTGGWLKLASLCDDIGHRLTGSPALERAVHWAVARMTADGHANVRAEPVEVQRWLRGAEALDLVEPRVQTLQVVGLGNTVGTPAGGIQAEVVMAHDEAGLAALGDRVRGRIVLFDNPMPPWSEEQGSQYGPTVRFRVRGPVLAGRLGAVGVLVRSVTAHSLATLHTGVTVYDPSVAPIPAAAVTPETSAWLARLCDQGQRVVVRLQLDARVAGLVQSANVIGELRGRERPDEIVVIGGHLDSWDVGQGAHDDGAGVVAAMQALTLLRRARLVPRRTVRVVLWTNEENGLAGARAYARDHATEMPQHVAAIEADSGGFPPAGLGIGVTPADAREIALHHVRGLVQLLAPVGPQRAHPDSHGADVGPLLDQGVPALDLATRAPTYFDIHHTHADTLDKVDPRALQDLTAAMATWAWALAEWPGRLDKPGPGP
ncbi:MAG: M20/M25/M40 family metallo-hydrolase [Myxococcales bacterium]|nr:M20/M25/M40 family metallo-hydrolase [Myxococcales bacterium]